MPRTTVLESQKSLDSPQYGFVKDPTQLAEQEPASEPSVDEFSLNQPVPNLEGAGCNLSIPDIEHLYKDQIQDRKGDLVFDCKENYLSKFWKLYLQNEDLVNEI